MSKKINFLRIIHHLPFNVFSDTLIFLSTMVETLSMELVSLVAVCLVTLSAGDERRSSSDLVSSEGAVET